MHYPFIKAHLSQLNLHKIAWVTFPRVGDLRNESNIFSVDRGINQKKNGKLLQQCATH